MVVGSKRDFSVDVEERVSEAFVVNDEFEDSELIRGSEVDVVSGFVRSEHFHLVDIVGVHHDEFELQVVSQVRFPAVRPGVEFVDVDHVFQVVFYSVSGKRHTVSLLQKRIINFLIN